MRVIGIEIKGREIRLVVLEQLNSIISDITGNYKPIKLEDDETSENVILFRNSLFAIFNNFNPNKIVIKWRNPKPTKAFQQENNENNFSASPISFKLEGLIQTYEKPETEISLIKPQTVTAYLKKNPLVISAKFTYQTEALKVAFYQIMNNK
jgi:hypothetical protein